MSGILYREYKESRQRSVVFLTVLPPKDWEQIVCRFLETEDNRRVTDIDLSCDDSAQINCYELTITLPMGRTNRDQLLTLIFGDEFLEMHLPITDKSRMGDTSGVFVRMGSMANPEGPPSGDEEFALISILKKRGTEQNSRHWECIKEFDKTAIIERIGHGIIADVEAVRKQVKKHRVEGGSWLLHPQDRIKGKKAKPEERKAMCNMAFDKIVKSFLEGVLPDCGVTRVTYPLDKGVIKVYNEKSEYFEESAKVPRPDMKQIYAADIEVNQTYLSLSLLDLDYMKLKYKPEIFTVWTLHAHDIPGAILTLYHDLPHAVKMEIAKNCVFSSPSPSPPESPSPEGTLTPYFSRTSTPTPTDP